MGRASSKRKPAPEPELSLAAALVLAHQEGLISLAGDAAARRALRGSPGGWRKLLSPDAVKAAHEAGHVVIGTLFGQYCFGASIVTDPNVKLGAGVWGGFALLGKHPEPSSEPAPAPTMTDRQTAVKLAWLSCSTPTWKTTLRIVRAWRSEADALLERNWLVVSKLAGELLRRRTLSRSDIASLLAPHMQGK